LPSGKAGKEFIDEITRLINEWSNETPLRGIALKAVIVMPSLLLQKPKRNSIIKCSLKSIQKANHFKMTCYFKDRYFDNGPYAFESLLIDADGWRRILTSASIGTSADNLCNAIATIARKICSFRDNFTDKKYSTI